MRHFVLSASVYIMYLVMLLKMVELDQAIVFLRVSYMLVCPCMCVYVCALDVFVCVCLLDLTHKRLSALSLSSLLLDYYDCKYWSFSSITITYSADIRP